MTSMRENRPCVLVVDDLVDATDSLVMLLKLWGYDAEGCYDGPTALDAARVRTPKVVLVDLKMPKMNGFQVARRFREQSEMPPVVLIAVTGCADSAYRIQAHEAGFDYFLVKPVELDKLRDLLLQETGHFSDHGLSEVATPAVLVTAAEVWSP